MVAKKHFFFIFLGFMMDLGLNCQDVLAHLAY